MLSIFLVLGLEEESGVGDVMICNLCYFHDLMV